MPATTKKDRVEHLIEGTDEVIKGHDKQHPKRKSVDKPWHLEGRLSPNASEFWRHMFRRRGSDWHVAERYKSQREANDNCAKKGRELGRAFEYRVVFKPNKPSEPEQSK